ncbi:MAG: NADH-quinone oxidoreductase subunit NuoK [Candidatus Limnocylindria bacterium]|nr:NADH-quinone oxidoreductase subunit NuoK [Candidatus Limnocylindria bacterium]
MTTVPLAAFIAVSTLLFFIGAAGVLMKRNAVVILMCVELMLNAANLALVAFSRRYGSVDERGSVFVVFVFVIAAAEVAVGLAIVLSAYRNRPTVDVDELHQLKG